MHPLFKELIILKSVASQTGCTHLVFVSDEFISSLQIRKLEFIPVHLKVLARCMQRTAESIRDKEPRLKALLQRQNQPQDVS